MREYQNQKKKKTENGNSKRISLTSTERVPFFPAMELVRKCLKRICTFNIKNKN